MSQIKQEIEAEIKRIISTGVKLDIDKIKMESRLFEELGADSLTGVEIIMEIEEEFGISIPDKDVQHLLTVKDIAEYVKKLKKDNHCNERIGEQ